MLHFTQKLMNIRIELVPASQTFKKWSETRKKQTVP